MKNVTDEQLVSLCSGDDESAFNELYQRYKDKLFSFILQFVKNQKTAEDIFQETFVRVVKHSGRFDPKKKFSSWVYTIAANLCRDELKWRKRRRNQVSMESGDLSGDGTGLLLKDRISSGEKGPREKLELNERNALLNEAIGRLPEKFRMVMELNIRQGFKYREVAKILKCPLGTVKSRIHKAVEMLREDLTSSGTFDLPGSK
jgi:RNA polymerase sigma-70 factor, ECF subfamily